MVEDKSVSRWSTEPIGVAKRREPGRRLDPASGRDPPARSDAGGIRRMMKKLYIGNLPYQGY